MSSAPHIHHISNTLCRMLLNFMYIYVHIYVHTHKYIHVHLYISPIYADAYIECLIISHKISVCGNCHFILFTWSSAQFDSGLIICLTVLYAETVVSSTHAGCLTENFCAVSWQQTRQIFLYLIFTAQSDKFSRLTMVGINGISLSMNRGFD